MTDDNNILKAVFESELDNFFVKFIETGSIEEAKKECGWDNVQIFSILSDKRTHKMLQDSIKIRMCLNQLLKLELESKAYSGAIQEIESCTDNRASVIITLLNNLYKAPKVFNVTEQEGTKSKLSDIIKGEINGS